MIKRAAWWTNEWQKKNIAAFQHARLRCVFKSIILLCKYSQIQTLGDSTDLATPRWSVNVWTPQGSPVSLFRLLLVNGTDWDSTQSSLGKISNFGSLGFSGKPHSLSYAKLIASGKITLDTLWSFKWLCRFSRNRAFKCSISNTKYHPCQNSWQPGIINQLECSLCFTKTNALNWQYGYFPPLKCLFVGFL